VGSPDAVRRRVVPQRAYINDWADFAQWCNAQHLESLPARPETVGLYLAALAQTHKPSTITRRLAAAR
jgi:hypothetical protein